MPTIDLQSIHPPVVLAIDIGSSSVRALLYDAHGTQIPGSESQHPYRQRMTDDGGSESNPKELVYLAIRCVDDVTALASTAGIRIEGIGITSFWHGLLGLGPDGQPATPVYMWSDKRSGDDATAIAEEVDAGDASANGVPDSLQLLARENPVVATHPGRAITAVSHWVSVTDHLAQRLLGNLGTSISMASGTGLLNATTLTWDKPLLDLLGLDATNLPDITDRDDGTTSLTGEFSARWPSLAGVPWFPAIGDGAAANVGAGCVSAGSIALTIGTSAAMRVIVPGDSTAQDTRLPERIWRYRLDRQRQVLGGALSNGGNVTSWLARDLFDQEFGPLTEKAANMPPDSHGLTILPLLAGERSPSGGKTPRRPCTACDWQPLRQISFGRHLKRRPTGWLPSTTTSPPWRTRRTKSTPTVRQPSVLHSGSGSWPTRSVIQSMRSTPRRKRPRGEPRSAP